MAGRRYTNRHEGVNVKTNFSTWPIRNEAEIIRRIFPEWVDSDIPGTRPLAEPETDRTVLWGECYDCGKLPTVATDTDINERFCANCAEYTKSIGNSIKYDGEVREG